MDKTLRLDELQSIRELARKATPGPYKTGAEPHFMGTLQSGYLVIMQTGGCIQRCCVPERRKDDLKYFAALDPETVDTIISMAMQMKVYETALSLIKEHEGLGLDGSRGCKYCYDVVQAAFRY